jgi:para-nitrobenzyl esterase
MNVRKRSGILIVFAGLFTAGSLVAAIPEPIPVEGGLISGTPGWGWNVREFRGIPFAAPPTGNLRWRPPQPVIPWQGVRAADRFSPVCMQQQRPINQRDWNEGLIRTSEDCLYLNVWTPAGSASDRLPVMVYIYGGGGVQGGTSEPRYDGNAMAKTGVVVVSMNYRVNAFGWLAHPELTQESPHHSSGNYGALDQLAALQWAKKYISQFGGDLERITIWGQSAGSHSVNSLVASPLASGLFRGAIGQSGSAFAFGRSMSLSEAEAAGVKFAERAGAKSLADLRALPAEAILAAAVKNRSGMPGAIVDGWFLPQDVYHTFASGKQNDVALLTGITNDEGMAFTALRSEPPATLAEYTDMAKAVFGNAADSFLKLYPARTDAEVKQAYHDACRDAFLASQGTWARLQSTTGKSRVYLYLFSHVPPNPSGNGNGLPNYVGAIHTTELLYAFDNLRIKDLPWTDLDRKLAVILSSYWSNFGKTGDPNGAGLPNWTPYNPQDEQLLNIGDELRMEGINRAGMDLLAAHAEQRRHAVGGPR